LEGGCPGTASDFLAGTFPKPTIWADPRSVITRGVSVTIWSEGKPEAKEYHSYNGMSPAPWDTQYPLQSKTKVKFFFPLLTEHYAGQYHFNYHSTTDWSEGSNHLELVVTGERKLRVPSPRLFPQEGFCSLGCLLSQPSPGSIWEM
jgi:leukocyte immunoglobulin-like receptor